MTVFKNYFRIVAKHLGVILMFFGISVGAAVLNTSASTGQTEYRPKIAIFNDDAGSVLTENFLSYLGNYAEVTEGLENDAKEIQDALYEGKVNVILFVPEGFGEDLASGARPKIKMKKSVESLGKYIEFLANRYCFTAEAVAGVQSAEAGDAAGAATEKLDATIVVEMLADYDWGEVEFMETEETEKTDVEKLAFYYNFENYALLSILIFMIGTIMCIFNREEIRKRNLVSSLRPRSLALQLFSGHLVLAFLVWAVFVAISIIIYGGAMFSFEELFFAINSFCFTLAATALAYLVGSLIKNQNVISGVQNVIALGLSFISGCFVPLEYLDAGLVNAAKIFPSYWYIEGNTRVAAGETAIENCLVILGFGILYFVIATIILKKQKK